MGWASGVDSDQVDCVIGDCVGCFSKKIYSLWFGGWWGVLILQQYSLLGGKGRMRRAAKFFNASSLDRLDREENS